MMAAWLITSSVPIVVAGVALRDVYGIAAQVLLDLSWVILKHQSNLIHKIMYGGSVDNKQYTNYRCWCGFNRRVLYCCAGAAGPGAGHLRGAEQRGQPDPQNHDAHPVTAAVSTLPGSAGR